MTISNVSCLTPTLLGAESPDWNDVIGRYLTALRKSETKNICVFYYPLKPLDTIVLWSPGGFKGALIWSTMIPRGSSLSGGCTYNPRRRAVTKLSNFIWDIWPVFMKSHEISFVLYLLDHARKRLIYQDRFAWNMILFWGRSIWDLKRILETRDLRLTRFYSRREIFSCNTTCNIVNSKYFIPIYRE